MGYEDPGAWKQKKINKLTEKISKVEAGTKNQARLQQLRTRLQTAKGGSFDPSLLKDEPTETTKAVPSFTPSGGPTTGTNVDILGGSGVSTKKKDPTSDAFNKRMGETVTKAMDPTQGLSLGYKPFASESISGMKSAVSSASKPTSSYSQAEQEWKDAGKLSSEIAYTDTDYKRYDLNDQNTPIDIGYGWTMKPSQLKEFRKSGKSMTQGPGVVPSSGIHKDEGGNIIKNIPGESGKTRDRAEIYRKPSLAASSSAATKPKIESTPGQYVMRAGGATAGEEELVTDIKKKHIKAGEKAIKKQEKSVKTRDKDIKSAKKKQEKITKQTEKKAYKKEFKKQKGKWKATAIGMRGTGIGLAATGSVMGAGTAREYAKAHTTKPGEEVEDKTKKPTFRERREAKKEAKWKGKEEKGLTKALARQAKEEGPKKQTHGSLHVTKDGSTTKFGKGYSISTRKKSGKLVKKIYDEEGKKLGKTVRGKRNKVKQTARNIKANKQAGAPTRSWGME